jgi:hypothetical protein
MGRVEDIMMAKRIVWGDQACRGHDAERIGVVIARAEIQLPQTEYRVGRIGG